MTRLEAFSLANTKLKTDKSKQKVFDELVEETGWPERKVLGLIRHMPSQQLRSKYASKKYWSLLLLLLILSIEIVHFWHGEIVLSTFWIIFTLIAVPFLFIGMLTLSSTFYVSAALLAGAVGYGLLQNPGINAFNRLDYVELVACALLLVSGLVMRGRLMEQYTMTKIDETDDNNVIKTVYKVVFHE